MARGRRIRSLSLVRALALMLIAAPGCAAMRRSAHEPSLRPCTDGYAVTDDGWKLGVRRIRPSCPDPNKLPVVLCHGMGLNGTFWTITDDHLPGLLADHGYEVFVVDMRGSGGSHRKGPVGRINAGLRETFLLEVGGSRWTIDDQALHDVPAILDYVQAETGRDRVNWVGHSLGGMLIYPFLQRGPQPERIANFVGMGSTAFLEESPQRSLQRANRSLRFLLATMSTGRMARPMMFARLPGLASIDRLYYSADNVDTRTVSRFYGYTLEDPGRGALKQLDKYLEHGRLVSADGEVDYAAGLGRITVPVLLVAGEGDKLASVGSKRMTLDALGSTDKTMLRFGLKSGHSYDYGHCDLVWSRHAPREVFPPIVEWLDRHQTGTVDAIAIPQVSNASMQIRDHDSNRPR